MPGHAGTLFCAKTFIFPSKSFGNAEIIAIFANMKC